MKLKTRSWVSLKIGDAMTWFFVIAGGTNSYSVSKRNDSATGTGSEENSRAFAVADRLTKMVRMKGEESRTVRQRLI